MAGLPERNVGRRLSQFVTDFKRYRTGEGLKENTFQDHKNAFSRMLSDYELEPEVRKIIEYANNVCSDIISGKEVKEDFEAELGEVDAFKEEYEKKKEQIKKDLHNLEVVIASLNEDLVTITPSLENLAKLTEEARKATEEIRKIDTEMKELNDLSNIVPEFSKTYQKDFENIKKQIEKSRKIIRDIKTKIVENYNIIVGAINLQIAEFKSKREELSDEDKQYIDSLSEIERYSKEVRSYNTNIFKDLNFGGLNEISVRLVTIRIKNEKKPAAPPIPPYDEVNNEILVELLEGLKKDFETITNASVFSKENFDKLKEDMIAFRMLRDEHKETLTEEQYNKLRLEYVELSRKYQEFIKETLNFYNVALSSIKELSQKNDMAEADNSLLTEEFEQDIRNHVGTLELQLRNNRKKGYITEEQYNELHEKLTEQYHRYQELLKNIQTKEEDGNVDNPPAGGDSDGDNPPPTPDKDEKDKEYKDYEKEFDSIERRCDKEIVAATALISKGLADEETIKSFLENLDNLLKEIEKLDKEIEENNTLTEEQRNNLNKLSSELKDKVKEGKETINNLTSLKQNGFLDLLDGSINGLEKALESLDKEIENDTFIGKEGKENRKKIDLEIKRIENEIYLIETNLEHNKHEDEEKYNHEIERLNECKEKFNNLKGKYYSKCPLRVKAVKSGKNFFKKYKKQILIGLGIAASVALWAPVLGPALMYGNGMIGLKVPALKGVLGSINKMIASTIGAAKTTIFMGGGSVPGVWQLANGTALMYNATSSLLKGIGYAAIGSSPLIAAAIMGVKALSNKMKKFDFKNNAVTNAVGGAVKTGTEKLGAFGEKVSEKTSKMGNKNRLSMLINNILKMYKAGQISREKIELILKSLIDEGTLTKEKLAEVEEEMAKIDKAKENLEEENTKKGGRR